MPLTQSDLQRPLFISIPHSGEQVPDDCTWLKSLPEEILMCDVDRYVDHLYQPALVELNLPLVKTQWHRYAADMNRIPEDIDAGSVLGSDNPKGKFSRGFHWQITTLKQTLLPNPMSQELHQKLVKLIYEPFHESIRNEYQKFHGQGEKNIFHLDLHSMPSLGTSEHKDPGENRAEIVVSDCLGKSSCPEFVDLVIVAYVRAGFKVGYNWPYVGGRVSEKYGSPDRGQHTVQVELNRSLYMNEQTKKLLTDSTKIKAIQRKLQNSLEYVQTNLSAVLKALA